ncbi:MAG: hypothetical protein F9K23_09695 [Bacteroidetes bacterium]|nr:MAG: hypothetical protein F9K23_09695 [Bacteroidota bacterium]
MSLHKLFIFTKDTNASATEQGFQYQKLKTLKTWIENRIKKIDEVIYCDYEDDIFQRNLKEEKVKFRQIKLYSSNFSFSKEEIQKSLAHFFMLFVKGEYKFDDVNFLFETNSGVARKVKGNDADLLQEWAANQEALSHQLRDKCRIRVKAIIDEYIAETYEAKISSEDKTELQQAKNIYDQLSDETWNSFISSIKWQFDAIPQEQAIPLLLDDITALITNLPLPIDPAKVSTYISVLHFEIAIRTSQDSEEDKILNNQLLDILLLNEGSEKQKWYGEIFEKWSLVKEVKQFNIGAFYEVISAARHCRWEMHNSDHEGLWLGLLKKYIDLDETIILCRRKAIYEYLFLMLCPDPKTGQPKGKISEQHDLIRYYFKELEHRNSFADIEEDIILLQITQTQQLFNGNFLDAAEIPEWATAIISQIDKKIANPVNADELCQAYELKGHFIFDINPEKPLIEKIDAAIDAYKKILEPLKNAKTYSVSRLNDQLTKILNMFISQRVKDQVIEAIENFIIEIEELAAKTGRQHNSAHSLVERGVTYLNNPTPKNFLKALDCFHKAKDLWYLHETKDGYILALLNIAQVYSALGMHMASKYYGLCGVWASIHFGDYTTLKRISDSYAMVFHADFEQGAWMSALDDFEKFIHARLEFTPETLNLEEDSLLRNSVFDLSCILAATPLLHPDLSVFIEYQKTNLGWLYTNHLKEMIDAFKIELRDKDGFKQMLSNKLSDIPLNDVGANREVKFSLLSIEWKIAFKNNAALNAVAEEFCALLQITLCELGLLSADLYLLEVPVSINISLADDYAGFIHQHPSHENTVWDISIPVLGTKEPAKVQFHYGFLAANIKLLLNNLSLLPKDEFEKAFNDLYTKQKLGEKGLAINTYQKVYFSLLKEDDFNKSMRTAFQPLSEKDYNLTSSDMLMPVEGESVKYNRDQSIENIKNRYVNTVKRLSVSLSLWKKETEFQVILHELRQHGWLDWQILIALMNYVLTIKINSYMNSITATNESERRSAFQTEFNRVYRLDENECYMEIPVNWLRTAEFQFDLCKMPVDTLESFGLQNNMAHPNFMAVRSFLNKRFHFDTDDVSDSSPFKTI